MQHSMNSNPMERSSEAEFKEALEHIVEMKQYLLGMYEKIVDIQHAFIDIDRCRIEMYQIASHVARLTSWLATEEEKFQNAIKNQEGKKKEMENDRLTNKEKKRCNSPRHPGQSPRRDRKHI